MDNKKCVKELLSNVWKGEEAWDLSNFSEHLIFDSAIGKRVCAKEVKGILGTWLHAFPDMHLEVQSLQSYGNVIITEGRSTATHQQEFMGIPATNKKIEFTGATTFVFENDKIVRYSSKTDIILILNQLGCYTRREQYDQQSILEKNQALLIKKLQKLLPAGFTPCQVKCFALYLHSFSSEQIGNTFHISPRTAEDHIHKGLSKLQCSARHQAVEYMTDNHLFPLWQDLGNHLL